MWLDARARIAERIPGKNDFVSWKLFIHLFKKVELGRHAS